MKIRYLVYIAMAALVVALFTNRKIPSKQSARQPAVQTVASPAEWAPAEEPIGVMAADGKVRIVYTGATPVMKKP